MIYIVSELVGRIGVSHIIGVFDSYDRAYEELKTYIEDNGLYTKYVNDPWNLANEYYTIEDFIRDYYDIEEYTLNAPI